jgi:hypothetical protein
LPGSWPRPANTSKNCAATVDDFEYSFLLRERRSHAKTRRREVKSKCIHKTHVYNPAEFFLSPVQCINGSLRDLRDFA